MKYHIITFGCAANVADSERIASSYVARGYEKTDSYKDADCVVINTCMIRQMAEDRIYGLLHKLGQVKSTKSSYKIIVTGCMVGMAMREESGKLLKMWRNRMPLVDEFLPIEEVGFDYAPIRSDKAHALIPISNGCNNFCTYCVVPFSRGREISRPFDDIVTECENLAQKGYSSITLIGQNVNSYGADLLLGKDNVHVLRDLELHSDSEVHEKKELVSKDAHYGQHHPVYVKHLGRLRIPTLFPQLLERISDISGIQQIDFLSSNPWDFSNELIDLIASRVNISKQIHLPVQSGDNEVLKKMNRWYTREEYMTLIETLRRKIPNVSISTDIIVGFCGETEEQFRHTVELCSHVKFLKAYIAIYSDRPMTAAHKVFSDSVSHQEKKRRWKILEDLINKPNLIHKKKKTA